MVKNFWQQLDKPMVGLAPMDGVTDQPFRYIQKRYGQPDLIYTEFISVEGLCRGATQFLKELTYDQSQRPIIAQIYGTTPQHFQEAAVVVCELGFDGVDINMGCPVKNVAHSGAGAALIQTPKLAQEIVRATKTGVKDWANGKRARDCETITEEIWQEVEKRQQVLPALYQARQDASGRPQQIPVSLKTRLGFDQPVVATWIPVLLETELAAIALHGRTLRQGYKGQADWQQIGLAAQVVKAQSPSTLILGNGDVKSRTEAEAKAQEYGVDGVLIGRASLGNPFVFQASFADQQPPNFKQLAQLAIEHARFYEQTFQPLATSLPKTKYSFLPMRKHLAWYIKGMPGASTIRQRLVRVNNADEAEEILSSLLQSI